MSQVWNDGKQYQPPPQGKGRKVPTKQQLVLKGEEAAYTTLRAVYLEENPICTRPGCMKDANQIHHIVRGTAGKARSRLNSDTWLGVCSDECHGFIDSLHPDLQKALKEMSVRATIERLRK